MGRRPPFFFFFWKKRQDILILRLKEMPYIVAMVMLFWRKIRCEKSGKGTKHPDQISS